MASERSSHATSQHVCEECGKRFDTAYILESHAKDTKHRSYACANHGCGKTYTSRSALSRHRNAHNDHVSHQCVICPKTFKRKDHLDSHVRQRHPTASSSSGSSISNSGMGSYLLPTMTDSNVVEDAGLLELLLQFINPRCLADGT